MKQIGAMSGNGKNLRGLVRALDMCFLPSKNAFSFPINIWITLKMYMTNMDVKLNFEIWHPILILSVLAEPLSGPLLAKHEAAKALYSQIKAADLDDDEQWFSLASQHPDINCFIEIGDPRISKEFLNVKRWKLFIRYLSKRNSIVS